MVFTKDKKVQYSSATTCHICDGDGELGEDKVRDHCHLTGRFRGAAHNGCNINYKIPNFFSSFCSTIFRDMMVTCLTKSLKVLRTMVKNSSAFLTMKKNTYHSAKRLLLTSVTKNGKEISVKRELRFIDSFRIYAL